MKACGWVLLCALAGIASTTSEDEDGATAATKDQSIKTLTLKNFVFEYSIEDGNLACKLSYQTAGWIAVGFKPVKKMKGANIIIGYAGGDDFAIADHFGTGPITHKPDTEIGGKDNVIKGSCVENNGVTTMQFAIPLDSGDEKDVTLARGEKVRVIFAAGRIDKLGSKHVKVAGGDITL